MVAKDLFSLADEALYEAKMAGKNVVRTGHVKAPTVIRA
jgi:PleD family two-component response regulator